MLTYLVLFTYHNRDGMLSSNMLFKTFPKLSRQFLSDIGDDTVLHRKTFCFHSLVNEYPDLKELSEHTIICIIDSTNIKSFDLKKILLFSYFLRKFTPSKFALHCIKVRLSVQVFCENSVLHGGQCSWIVNILLVLIVL